jgi:hypothetical protein
MKWHSLHVDLEEKRSLNLCRGLLTTGDGWGSGSDFTSHTGNGSNYGYGYGVVYSDGLRLGDRSGNGKSDYTQIELSEDQYGDGYGDGTGDGGSE